MRRLLFLGTLTMLAACTVDDGGRTPIPSDGVSDHRLGAMMQISNLGEGTGSAFVWLEARDGSNVELVGSDSIDLLVGEKVVPLEPSWFEARGKTVSYTAKFPTAPGPVHVRLARRTGTLDSAVELPQAFELRLDSPKTFSRANDDVVLRWTSAAESERLYWYSNGGCIRGHGDTEIADTGVLVIPKGSWTRGVGACDVTIYVRRSRHGVLAPDFGSGGFIDGDQLRTMKLVAMP